jgi:hypothetical protein
MKRPNAAPTPGGASPDQQRSERKNRHPAGKISYKKAASDLEPGAPDIAHPAEAKKWERQTTFFTAWCFEMLERVDGIDEIAARGARRELAFFLRKSAGVLLICALKATRRTAREWAGKLLANIYQKIEKHDKKLRVTNAAYRQEREKFAGKSFSAALFPKGEVCKVAQQELLKARRYYGELRLFKEAFGRGWEPSAESGNVPKEYWPLVDLPEFSVKSVGEWSDFLWPLIEKKIDVSKMPPLKMREYDTVNVAHNPRTRKTEVSAGRKTHRKRYPSDSENTARGHLQLLAKLSDKGLP